MTEFSSSLYEEYCRRQQFVAQKLIEEAEKADEDSSGEG